MGLKCKCDVDGERVDLERFKMVVLSYMDKRLAQFAEKSEVEIIQEFGFTGDMIVARIVQQVWGREVQRQECRWPADWWQAFKERWLPAWAKRRWPVRYHIETMVARELYPQVALPLDRYKAVIAVGKSGQW